MSGRVIALVLVSFLLVVGAVMLAGFMPQEALGQLLKGSLGTKRAIGLTLKEFTPLLIAGVAVFLALKAGLFNIGVEGQFLMGAVVAAGIGVSIPGVLGLVLAIGLGALAGALWAFPAGWIKAYRGGHEVITTIMLNNVAGFFAAWLVAGPLKGPEQQSPSTAFVDPGARLPAIFSSPPLAINAALVLAVVLVPVLAFWLNRTVRGYELAATGANARAAEVAGVNVKRTTVWAMSVSGALGGLAGACQVLAYEGRFYEGFSPGYGFDALGVALLAGTTAWGLYPAAALFGILSTGTSSLAAAGVPKGLNAILLGLLILSFAAVRYRRKKA